MNRKQLLIVVVTLIFMISCTESKKGTETLKYVEEPHSYAQPNEAVITHLNLNIDVNFGTEVISGSASYAIDNNNASQIILDAKN